MSWFFQPLPAAVAGVIEAAATEAASAAGNRTKRANGAAKSNDGCVFQTPVCTGVAKTGPRRF